MNFHTRIKNVYFFFVEIPPNLTKCCSACFNRISRRLTPHIATEEETLRWTEEETEALKRGLKEYGISWSKISEKVGSKTHHQCKSFYFNCRKKLGLDLLVQEYNKVNLSIVLSVIEYFEIFFNGNLIFFLFFF